MHRLLLALSLASTLLAGCTPVPTGVTSTRVDLSNGEKIGFLVGTIGANTEASDANQYLLRLCDDSGKIVAAALYTVNFGLKAADVRDGDFAGDSFVIGLPEGRYEICDTVVRRKEYATLQIKAYNSATPIQVKAREIQYLGRFIGSADISTGLFEGRTIKGITWDVIDGQTLDLPAILKKIPASAPRPVMAVLPQSALKPPIFRPRATP